jgi:hypothetical protein
MILPYHLIWLIRQLLIFLHKNMTLSEYMASLGTSVNVTNINALGLFSVEPACRCLLTKFCLETPLSQIVILEGITNTHWAKVCVTLAIWWTIHELWLHSPICCMTSPFDKHLTPWICSMAQGSCANISINLFVFRLKFHNRPTHPHIGLVSKIM